MTTVNHSALRRSISESETQPAGWRSAVKADTANIAHRGYLWIGLSLLVFVGWGILFPLSSAVVASGSVISKGRNQLLQHPSGGVVQEIMARNGDVIEKGEPIIRVEPSIARAELARLHARQSLLLAQKSRLEFLRQPTREMRQAMSTPIAGLRGPQDRSVKQRSQIATNDDEILAGQVSELYAALDRHESEVSALENRAASQQSEYDGLISQIATRRELVSLLEKEVVRMEQLVESGLISLTRFDAKKAAFLEQKAGLAALKARAAALKSQIRETGDTINTLSSRQKEENARDLSAVLSELSSVTEQIDAATKTLEQTVVRSPVSGTLVKFQANTVGGVIEGGKPFGEIVPGGAEVFIEAKVRPMDIGAIQHGQATEVVITAFNRREQPPLEGTVDYVPADSTIDDMTGEPYFAVQIDVSESASLITDTIQPGMLSEVYIRTGEHSFFTYLLEPFSRSFMTAFRER